MAGTRVTQLAPDALPGRREGSFAGKGGGAAGPHPVGKLTQLAPVGVPWERYGAFAGKPPAAEVVPSPPQHGGRLFVERRPLLRFTHVAKGGLEVDGRARLAVGTSRRAIGGLALDGQARSSAGLAWLTDGGLEVDGAAGISAGHLHHAQGALTLSGEVAVTRGLAWAAAGGAEVDGVAETDAGSPYRDRLPQRRRAGEDLLLSDLF